MAKTDKSTSRYTRKYKKGSVLRKKGTNLLWILFFYFGERVEFSTGDVDTADNFEKWERWLDGTIELIEKKSFVYSDAFPGASPKKKALFASYENLEVKRQPSEVKFEDFADSYKKKVLKNFKSVNKRDDYESRIDYRLIPFFGDMTFSRINRNVIIQFIAYLNTVDRDKK